MAGDADENGDRPVLDDGGKPAQVLNRLVSLYMIHFFTDT